MADDDKGSARALQFILEPCDRLDIEVVRRLVQQHQLRLLGHQPRKGRSPPLTTAGGGHGPRGVELQPFARPLHLVHLTGIEAMGREIA